MTYTLDILSFTAEILFSNCTNNMEIIFTQRCTNEVTKKNILDFFWSLNTLEHLLFSSKDALDSIREGNPSSGLSIRLLLCYSQLCLRILLK